MFPYSYKLLNCKGCGNVIFAHITLTMLLTKVVFHCNRLSNSFRFYGKNMEY